MQRKQPEHSLSKCHSMLTSAKTSSEIRFTKR